jgi:hypothetical protein
MSKRMNTHSETWLNVECSWIRTRGYHLGEPLPRQFNYDSDCWNNYVNMQADTAKRSGYPTIENDIRQCLITSMLVIML